MGAPYAGAVGAAGAAAAALLCELPIAAHRCTSLHVAATSPAPCTANPRRLHLIPHAILSHWHELLLRFAPKTHQLVHSSALQCQLLTSFHPIFIHFCFLLALILCLPSIMNHSSPSSTVVLCLA